MKNNNSVLIISTDELFIEKIKEYKYYENFDISFFTEDRFYFISDNLHVFDLIIFDNRNQTNRNQNNFVRFLDIHKITQSKELNIPIIILDNIVCKDIPYYNNINIYSLLKMPITNEMLFTNISLCLNYLNSNLK